MPTGKDHIVYWDTCIFLAWMNDETRQAGEMEGLGKIAELVMRAEVTLVTSTITRAEILQSKTSQEAMKKYDGLLRRSNVVPQNVDLSIAKLTSELMDFYIDSDFELLTPDAIHLATAIHYNVHEFHTFDGCKAKQKPKKSKYKRSGLLLLDGSVAGRILRVIRPSADQYELALKPLSAGEEGEFKLEPVDVPEPPKLHLVPAAESLEPKSKAKTPILKVTPPESK
jgi:predicted nucleic acid-binding protein